RSPCRSPTRSCCSEHGSRSCCSSATRVRAREKSSSRSSATDRLCVAFAPSRRLPSLRSLSPLKVRVGLVDPVLTHGAEDVDHERVLEHVDAVRHAARNLHHLAAADDDLVCRLLLEKKNVENDSHLLVVLT